MGTVASACAKPELSGGLTGKGAGFLVNQLNIDMIFDFLS
jgi:hypothetical protein